MTAYGAVSVSGTNAELSRSGTPSNIQHSMCGWWRCDGGAGTYRIMYSWEAGSGPFVGFNDTNQLFIYGGFADIPLGFTPPIGEPFFVGYVADPAGVLKAYVRRASSRTWDGAVHTLASLGFPVSFGVGGDTSNEPWIGAFWNQMCWEATLTPEQLLRQSFQRSPIIESRLYFHWPLRTSADLFDFGPRVLPPSLVGTAANQVGVNQSRRRSARKRQVVASVSTTAYSLTCGQVSYDFSPQAAILRASRKFAAAQVSYAFNPQSVGLKFGHNLPVGLASYAFNPQGVALRRAAKLLVGNASYAFSPQAIALTYNPSDPVLAIGSASYTFSPQQLGLKRGLKLPIGQAAYNFNPQVIGALRALKLPIGQVSYTFSPQAVTFRRALKLTAAFTGYNFNPQAVTLNYHALAAVLNIQQAAYAFNPQSVGLKRSLRLNAGQASYTFTPQQIGMLRALKLLAANAAYAFNPQAVALRAGRRIQLGAAAYAFTPQSLALFRALKLLAASTSYSFAPQAIGLIYTPAAGLPTYPNSSQELLVSLFNSVQTLELDLFNSRQTVFLELL